MKRIARAIAGLFFICGGDLTAAFAWDAAGGGYGEFQFSQLFTQALLFTLAAPIVIAAGVFTARNKGSRFVSAGALLAFVSMAPATFAGSYLDFSDAAPWLALSIALAIAAVILLSSPAVAAATLPAASPAPAQATTSNHNPAPPAP
jgi:hypothetical protein